MVVDWAETDYKWRLSLTKKHLLRRSKVKDNLFNYDLFANLLRQALNL